MFERDRRRERVRGRGRVGQLKKERVSGGAAREADRQRE